MGKKIFCFDIDETITAGKVPEDYYELAKPNNKMIKIINQLYNKGHTIIVFTARGSGSGKNWDIVTKEQLYNWGLKYHSLLFGKPVADYFIDDKNLTIAEFYSMYSGRVF